MHHSSPTSLILASASPRRRELLERLAIPFIVRAADIDETPLPGEQPEQYVKRLAIQKAKAVWQPGDTVLSADTTVVTASGTLGKPRDASEAAQMLQRLSGATHQVITGFCFFAGDVIECGAEVTAVTFGTLTAAEIEEYVATGEPFGKAGGYAIQGLAGRFVSRIDGCYYNVVGLPLNRVYRFIRDNLR